jgi:hypothetical protein
MATWLKTDGTSEEVSPANSRDFKLDELRRYTATGRDPHETTISMPWADIGDGKRRIMVCNEDAHDLDLPVNAKATEAYLRAIGNPNYHWEIRGDTLVCEIGEIE